jgi:hypothetical protein
MSLRAEILRFALRQIRTIEPIGAFVGAETLSGLTHACVAPSSA